MKPINRQPIRSCIGCRKRLPQVELLRFICENSVLIPDQEKRKGGRGAYVCRSGKCVEIALKKSKIVNSRLRVNLSIDAVNKFRGEIIDLIRQG